MPSFRPHTSRRFDAVVIGAGPAGLCFALSLERAGVSVAIVERQPLDRIAHPAFDGREIALTDASVDRLRRLGVWSRIPSDEVSPLRVARVLNGASSQGLDLRHPVADTHALARLVSNHVIRRALYERIEQAHGIELLCGERVTAVRPDSRDVEVELGGGTRVRASLVVAADSRFSETRTAMGISARIRDFGRTMTLFRVECDRPHHGVAYEWFDYGQTIALLPLNGGRYSVVLTLSTDEMRRMLALDVREFDRDVERRLAPRGRMRRISERFSYPVVTVYPSRFTAARYALIGDAAVGMHPVTAHGFNFGLLGATTLARIVAAAAARGQDIGAADVLDAYERRHRLATLPLYLATNGIAELYTRDAPPMRFAREAILRLSDRAAPLKTALTAFLTRGAAETAAVLRRARGDESKTPRLTPRSDSPHHDRARIASRPETAEATTRDG
ncbi:MAG TPA: 5-demethoxyubiquinol-8 5-hydroxylase UbiM [Gammaproteobacteria bacterium]